MPDLSAILREQISRQGPLPFDRFMQFALYCPELGYYERTRSVVGRSGDFTTSVSVGAAFGRLLAAQFHRWISGSDIQRPAIVECGAHDGRLMADVISALQDLDSECLNSWDWWIVEPSEIRRCWQEETLRTLGATVRWAGAMEELPRPLQGVIYSNELLDAFPVRRLGWDATRRQWFEWGVDWNGERFDWRRMEVGAAGPSAPYRALGLTLTASEQSALEDVLPDGFIVELCPGAIDWWKRAAQSLDQGWLMAFDYGMEVESLFRPERTGGTLRSYRDHRSSSDVLASPGEQDITAHVNFTAIRQAGELQGLTTEFLGSQERFLIAVLKALTVSNATPSLWTNAEQRQLMSLVHTGHFGGVMRVLTQSRGIRVATNGLIDSHS